MLMNRARISAIGTPLEVITEKNIRDVYGCNVIVDKHPVAGTPRVSLISEDNAFQCYDVPHTNAAWRKS